MALSPNARVLLGLLKQRNGEELKVEAARKKAKLDHSAVVHAMKELDEAGEAQFKLGRRGWSTRLEPLDDCEEQLDQHEESSGPTHTHSFTLARPVPFSVVAPADLKRDEVKKLIKWLNGIAEDDHDAS